MKLPLKLINMSMNVISSFSSILRFLTCPTTENLNIWDIFVSFRSLMLRPRVWKNEIKEWLRLWKVTFWSIGLGFGDLRNKKPVSGPSVTPFQQFTTPIVVNSTETRQMDHVDYPKDYTFGRISIFIISQIMEILPRNQEVVFDQNISGHNHSTLHNHLVSVVIFKKWISAIYWLNQFDSSDEHIRKVRYPWETFPVRDRVRNGGFKTTTTVMYFTNEMCLI